VSECKEDALVQAANFCHGFIKNEAHDPTSIDDDAIEEYVRSASQPGGLRSIFGICTFKIRP
jgi:hypothetical protein